MNNIFIPNLNSWGKETDNLIWQLNKLKFGSDITLDANKLRFIEPSGAIFLILLCRYIYMLTGRRTKIVNMYPQVLFYLNSINFFESAKNWAFSEEIISFSFWSRLLYNRDSRSVIQITRLKDEIDIYDFTEKCQIIFEKWFSEQYFREYRNRVATIIVEVCSNALDHSGSDSFAMLQKYSKMTGNQVIIAVGDLGIGIREHLKKAHRWIGSHDVDFIEKALGGLSGRQDSTGGFGLKTILKITSHYKGRVLLRSGKGMVEIIESYKKHYFKYSFPGTQYLIQLNP